MKLSRRHFIQMAGVGSGLMLSGCRQRIQPRRYSAHVVVVGGGFGGATAAKTIRELDDSIKVTLIEPKAHYVTCPASNWVLAGLRNMESITFNYEALASRYGIAIIHDRVIAVDADRHRVKLSQDKTLSYDRLIMAPGIDFRWNDIEGYDAETAEYIPHAWQAGKQTETLLKQVRAMPENGTIVISAPANPFRCPPGPYERASLLAHYCQKHKPRAKIVILDHKRAFSKQALFIQGWKQHYGYGTGNSRIEWQSITDNPVISLAAKSKTLQTDFGDCIKAQVLNIIPAQKAGKIAQLVGLTDKSGWCPVAAKTSESKLLPDIHVIGDAAIHSPMPKSAFASSSQAKVCALAVASLLKGREPVEPVWVNTCYSLVNPDHGISIAMVYKLNGTGNLAKVEGAGGVSAKTDRQSLLLESLYAQSWYDSITADTFS